MFDPTPIAKFVVEESSGSTDIWGPLGAIAAVLALVGIVVGVITYRRQFPKRKIEYTVDAVRLMAQALPAGTVEVKVQGIEVSDPYLTTISFVSSSRADIPSSAFDAGRSIVVHVEPGGAVLLERSSEVDSIAFSGGKGEGMDWAEFRAAPQLVRAGATGTISFVSDGPPTVTVDSPLVDIKVIEVRPELSERKERNRLLGAAIGAAVLAFIGLVLSLINLLSGLFPIS